MITHAATKGLEPCLKMKPSGIDRLGRVPAHWTHHKLGYITAMRGGSTPSTVEPAFWNGDVPWVSPKDMKRDVIGDSEDQVTSLAISETGLELIHPPVVLMVVRGMILAHSFPVALTSAPVTVNQDMKALRATSKVMPEYPHSLLLGIKHSIRALSQESGRGTRVPRTELWKRFGVYLPSPEEQNRMVRQIAGQCSLIDRLVTEIEAATDRLREYRSAPISAAVTGQIDVRAETKRMP